MTALTPYCVAKGCIALPPTDHLKAHLHGGCTGPEMMRGLLDAHDAEVAARVRADVLAEQSQVALSDRCPRCRCADCGGRFDRHRDDGSCWCEDCRAWPETACAAFEPEEGIGWVAEQLGPLLSSHLNPAAAARCRAVAHAAHHALRDYDQAREQMRAHATASQET